MLKTEKEKAFVIGFATGDALGVPVEFATRGQLQKQPIKEMIGYGNHWQVPGTWSDDTSLTVATIDSLVRGYDPEDIAKKFIEWLDNGKYSANGYVFDIGSTTRFAILRAKYGDIPAISCGGTGVHENGNGSLMRILPLAFFLQSDENFEHRKKVIYEVSSITHAHIVSKIACHFLVEFAIKLLKNDAVDDAYEETRRTFSVYYKDVEEAECFLRIFNGMILNVPVNEIRSSGYVVDTLEAAVWCIFHTKTYKDAVLTAVNLGGDTDTIGAITGGLAGIIYGYKAIPQKWEEDLENKELLYYAADQLQVIREGAKQNASCVHTAKRNFFARLFLKFWKNK